MEGTSYIILTYAMLLLSCWSSVIALGVIGNILRARRERRTCRQSDKLHLLAAAFVSIASSTIAFVHPGLVHHIPSTIAALEIGSIPPLLYLTEKHIKDWVRLCEPYRKAKTKSTA